MKHFPKKAKVFSFALLAFSFLASAQAGVLPKTARLLPPETVLLTDIDNFSQLRGQFEKTSVYKLYKDPAMAAFVEDFKTKRQEKVRKLDNEIAEAVISADILPEGRVAVALVLNEQTKEANEPPFLFITEWGENTAKIKEAVEKQVEKAIEDGSHRKTEDYRGVSIITIIRKSSEPLSYCFIDDCLIVSANLDVLKFVIAHIKGASSPTLADDADYTSTIAAVGPYHDIDFYVNIKQIIKMGIAEDSSGKAQSTIANLGLDNAAAFGFSVGLGRAGSSCSGKALLKVEGGKKGILKMLEVESGGFRAPRFIPASAYSVSFLNLNIGKAYSTLGNILTSFSPQAAAWMYMPLPTSDSPDKPGLKIKDDIIDYLGSQIVIAQSINKPFSKNSTPTETLVALAASNHIALEKSLSLLHGMMTQNNPEARRELLGHTIYVVNLLALMPPFMPGGRAPMQAPLEESCKQRPHRQYGLLTGQAPAGPRPSEGLGGPIAPQMPKVAFTITDTHLILGAEAGVERAIRRLSSAESVSVDSAKWFTSARLSLPSVVGMAGLQDNAASGELLWWMMKESTTPPIKTGGATIPMVPNPALMFSQIGLDLFKFDLLPDYDIVRKYFGLSTFYGVSRPDGFFFEFEYLNPSGTN